MVGDIIVVVNSDVLNRFKSEDSKLLVELEPGRGGGPAQSIHHPDQEISAGGGSQHGRVRSFEGFQDPTFGVGCPSLVEPVVFPGGVGDQVAGPRVVQFVGGEVGEGAISDEIPSENTGVLLYVLLADHKVEIVADRGISAKVAPSEWQSIVAAMQAAFREGRFEKGAVDGVLAVSALLERHFPAGTENANELPDAPVML